jgi:Cdc6-like AAA superfamily ATPase
MDKIQERAIYLALRGHNILITGFPGTGKSFTVIELAKQLKLSP